MLASDDIASSQGKTSVQTIATKEDFIEGVRKWVAFDNELQTLNTRVRSLRDERTQIMPALIQYMDENGLRDHVLRVTDGTLKYHESTVQQGLTQKFLQEALVAYFGNDVKKADECFTFIKERREQKKTVSLKRTYNVDRNAK